ncbi:MAG: hypothetical protein KKH98_02680 [Spirochaetes bacterium]|nr:hypothetical protein [Spirochaetota bacterium]
MLEFDLKEKSIPKWLIKNKAASNIIISSRARIARNIKGFPYLYKLEKENKKKILDLVLNTIKKMDPPFSSMVFVNLGSQSSKFKKFLKERFLVTDYLLKGDNKEVVFDKDEYTNIMINEEDHIRIQVIYPDLNIQKAYNKISIIEKEIEKFIDLDFDIDFGYLTACPTNVGTGLRVSVMLHLPALAYSFKMKELTDNLIESGFAVRGFYGEGTKFMGDLYQISNQVSLGINEGDIIKKVENIVLELEKRELLERKKMSKNKNLLNKIVKSYLVLNNSKHISLSDGMKHLSLLQLGEYYNYIKIPDKQNFNKLLIMIQPMHLIYLNNIELEKIDSVTENKLRAEFIKKFLKRGKICLKNSQQEPSRL